MLPFALVYHDDYDQNFGVHVFPTQKYRLIRERLLAESVAGPEDFLAPEPATREQLLLAHSEDWIRKLETGTLSYHEILRLEVPYSRRMADAFFLAAGGTLLAARRALKQGVGFNVGGGYHHAFRSHGEGFCAINDVAVAIRSLQQERTIGKALVIDCDVHQGNGTAAMFANDNSVFTISLHQLNNYPYEKPPSDVDVNLADGTEDSEYLEKLQNTYGQAVNIFRPDLIVYVAGADPYFDDQLGGLALTKSGMKQRDRIVLETAVRAKTPVAVTLAGGYARKLEDTVDLHTATAHAAREVLVEAGR
jgi:acetoin utilization deacetylase AcuC-like enzyme